jgi:tetratricopeptide (TPR) repeat protein
MKHISTSIIAGLALCAAAVNAAASSQLTQPKFDIVLDKPKFVLPQFTGPYQEREASIVPSEYEAAERMRGLLDSGEKGEVLKELETFYSIELSPAMLTLKAQIYFSLEMYDKAEDTYLTVLKRMPQLVRVHSDLGQLYLVKEDYSKAREHFARAVALGSNDAMIHGQLGYLNLMLHGPYAAISSYQQAAALEPSNFQWQQGLLSALTQAEMFTEAQAQLKQMIAQKPNSPELWLNQAALSLHQEDYRRALTSLEMALALGDKDLRNIKTAAQLHLHLGSYDRAVALLDRALSSGKLEMASLNEYFSWLSQLGMWDKAQQMLQSTASHVDQLNRNDKSQYYFLRARLDANRGQVESAKAHFRQALEQDPTNGACLVEFAAFSAKQKNYVDAELLYLRAESISGFEKQALLGRAQVYVDMQDYPAALNQMKAAFQKFPDMLELRNNIDILENIVRTRESI